MLLLSSKHSTSAKIMIVLGSCCDVKSSSCFWFLLTSRSTMSCVIASKATPLSCNCCIALSHKSSNRCCSLLLIISSIGIPLLIAFNSSTFLLRCFIKSSITFCLNSSFASSCPYNSVYSFSFSLFCF